MAFGNISTFYIPTAANAGASQWGSDVRKLLDSADAGSDNTSITDHGTGGAVTRTVDPYTTKNTDDTQANFGWAITPSDMNSISGARRFFGAGDHTATIRMNHNGATGATGTLTMFIYRVGPTPTFTRTLLGSNSASVVLPALGAEVTGTVTVALSEVVFEIDETIQYSFEFNVTGIAVTGRLVRFFGGTQTSVAARLDTPILKVLADTTGTASGTGAASGVTGKVLGTDGSSSGIATVLGEMSTRSDFTGSASGVGVASGQMSSVFSFTGTAAGTVAVAGLTSIVLGTVGTVNVSEGGGGDTIIKKTVMIFDD